MQVLLCRHACVLKETKTRAVGGLFRLEPATGVLPLIAAQQEVVG